LKVADELNMNTFPETSQEMYLYSIEIKESQYNSSVFYHKMTDENVKIGLLTTKCFEDVSFLNSLFVIISLDF
jgi:hypothetical protein